MLMGLLYQGDILGNVQVRQKRGLQADRYDQAAVQVFVEMAELFVVGEELYSDCRSNVNTSMVKMATKSRTMPLRTAMGMPVVACPDLRPL